MRLIYRPIDAWPGPLTAKRTPSQFKSSWNDTKQDLERELRFLGVEGTVVIQLAVEEKDIRLSGELRTGAVIRHPGVILSFESKHGPLMYACDKFVKPSWKNFTSWHQNVRAIVLTLEALRAVDRYGATKAGEQYRGFAALPPGRGASSRDDAIAILKKYAGTGGPDWLPIDYYRHASKRTHPDAGGSNDAFNAVQQAWRFLENESA